MNYATIRRRRVCEKPLVLKNAFINIVYKQWWWVLVEAKKLHGEEHLKLNMGIGTPHSLFSHSNIQNTTRAKELKIMFFVFTFKRDTDL